MQYSGAQNIVPISKEIQVPPDIVDEPPVKGDDGKEPEVPEEEPEVPEEEPVVPEEEPEVPEEEPEAQVEEQPQPTGPTKGVPGGLDITNLTELALPTAYKIKIIFDAIQLVVDPAYQGCEDVDMGVYVQGKLVRLNNINQPLKICGNKVEQLKEAEATVEIPGESVESPRDYQPLSIFSIGSTLDNCNPKPLPADLPEVRKILADKGSTRPYYAHAKEQIGKIRDQISNGCIQTSIPNFYGGGSTANMSLATFNVVFGSPGYGKVVPENTLGNPERAQINSCHTYPYGITSSFFCLFYTIECPLCPAVRVH